LNRPFALAAAPLALALAACPAPESDTEPAPEHLYAAKAVIGQATFDALPSPAACGPATLVNPYGSVAWDGTTLVVPDTVAMRLLAFQPLPTSGAGISADWAIGDSTGATTLNACDGLAAPFFSPQMLAFSGSTLLVSDPFGGSNFEGKVFLYDPLPADSGAAAVPVEVGTDDTSPSGLSMPEAAIVAGGKLFVADTGHHRVLVWDPVPSGPTAATLVLGQAGFTAGATALVAYNDTDADGVAGAAVGPGYSVAPSAATMREPKGLWSDGTRLVVADTGNNRLLVWNTLPSASGASADVVVGQPVFTTGGAQVGAGGLTAPYSVASDGTRLFVADSENHRVLVYGTFPASNGASATAVLGQRTFTGHAANDDDGDGVSDATPSAGSMDFPTGVAVVSGKLFVTDTNNSRVLVFDPPTP
jgi:hypothetical protein